MKLTLNGHCFDFKAPALMGILNLTPDSFSDGNAYNDPKRAVSRAHELHKAGAQIIDLGAESTRPGSQPVSEDEELRRLCPVLDALPKDEFIISVDSNKPTVQLRAIEMGAHMVNDVYGGNDTLFHAAAKANAGLVLMHTSATPETMQTQTQYADLMDDIDSYLRSRAESATQAGVQHVWVDPGIGFGKTLEQNLTLMKHLKRFRNIANGCLIGTSRKSWIGKLTGAKVHQRVGASISSALFCLEQGAQIIRVHDVEETAQSIHTWQTLQHD